MAGIVPTELLTKLFDLLRGKINAYHTKFPLSLSLSLSLSISLSLLSEPGLHATSVINETSILFFIDTHEHVYS